MKAIKTFVTLTLCLILLTSTALVETGDMSVMMSGINMENYPVTTEETTYTAWMANDYIVGDPSETMPIFQLFREVTGVNFEWTVVSTVDLETQKSLILAGGEIPDVSFGVFNDKDVLAYGPLGLFLAYDPYIDEYMPNLKYMATEVSPALKQSLTLSDGHIYTLPKLGAPNVPTTTAIYYNKLWLEQLNMDVPTTTDELFDLLVAIKEHAGEGVIPENAIPLSWSMPNVGWTVGQLNAAFGVTPDNAMIKDGVVYYPPYTDEWKDMVLFVNKCWKAGLMDEEMFTQDDATFVAKGREEMYGVVQSYSTATFLNAENFDDYGIMPALNGGAYRQRPEGSYTVLNKGVISAAVKNPEVLMAALDLMYDSAFNFQVIYGPMGLVSSIDDEGNYCTMSEPPKGYATVEAWSRSFSWNQLPGGMVYTDKHDGLLQSVDRLLQYEMAEKYEDHWVNEVMIYGFQTVEESELLNGYLTDLKKYASQKYAEWVTGECDVEAEWEDYKAQLEKMHVQDYIDAYQSYYNRIMGK